MPRLFGPVVLSLLALSLPTLSAQIASTTNVTALPATSPYGTQTTISAGVAPATTPYVNPAGVTVLPSGTVQFLDGTTALGSPAPLTSGSGYTTTPFSNVFGAIDASFNDVSGQLAGDLNADGTQDLLIYRNIQAPYSGSNVSSQVSVEVQTFLSKAGGSYAPVAPTTLNLPIPLPINDLEQFAPVLADLNGDGKLDLLIGPSVAYGNGDGTFQQPVTLSFLATGYMNTFSADLNGDGKADIVALAIPPDLSAATVTLQMTVFLNQGSGSFQSAGTFAVATGSCPCESLPLASLSFADLNGDGKLDMVTQSFIFEPDYPAPAVVPSPVLTSFLNNGDGTFAAGVVAAYNPPAGNAFILPLETDLVADFNGDGKADIVLVYPSNILVSGFTSPVIFLPGNGDGTFGTETDTILSYPMAQQGPEPAGPGGAAVVTDANLDGLPDLVFGTAAVALGNGHGSFSAGPPVQATAAGLSGQSLGFLQPAGSALPYLVFAGNPAGAGAAATSFVATHDLTSTASLAPMTLGVGTHSISAKYSGDGNYTASISAPGVVTIASATPAVSATSSANPAYVTQTITYSVAVSSPGSIPTGTVVLNNGSTQLGTGTLDATGKTTITASFATPVSAILSAAYSGDATHTAATKTLVQIVVPAFAVAAGAGSPTITVPSGQSASTQLSVAGGANFSGTVSLTCSGLPSNAVCTFNPATLNISGATAQNTTLTVSTGGATTARLLDPFSSGRGLTVACGLLAGSLLLRPRRRRSCWIACLFVGMVLLPIGCGGNSSTTTNNNTPAGSYPFRVIATAGMVQTDTNYTLIVQ